MEKKNGIGYFTYKYGELEWVNCNEDNLCILVDFDTGDYDYLFFIEPKKLREAVSYTLNKRMNGEDEYTSDIELITEYLDNNNVVYKMFSLFDANRINY